jgi:hypothetical protein
MPWDARGVLRGSRTGSLARGRAAAACLAALLFVGAPACQGPQHRASEPEPPAQARSAPDWIHAPLSWEKLASLERWLADADSVHDRGQRLEARLQLAEGRVEFTRRDRDKGLALDAAARARLQSAGAELAAVGADAYATPGQRTRAQIAHARAELLLAKSAPVAAAAPKALEGVLERSRWRAKPPRQADLTPVGGPWTRITVHHSAEVGDTAPGVALSDSVATLQRIQKVHMDRGDPNHGWADIGYHFLIDGSGRVFEGRSLKWQGAHARGDNNVQNIGVCLLGDYSKRAPGRAELQALEDLLDALRERHDIPLRGVATHRELVATACPGPALQAWVERYRRGALARR